MKGQSIRGENVRKLLGADSFLGHYKGVTQSFQ